MASRLAPSTRTDGGGTLGDLHREQPVFFRVHLIDQVWAMGGDYNLRANTGFSQGVHECPRRGRMKSRFRFFDANQADWFFAFCQLCNRD